ncbi:MAG TPA: polysaccharide deacetylase family protein [Gammaproteobacteria bacterium]|jgi:peptidoglycan/xylan/chitin deacetylase (PgdA/CDA1 family)|nr:polysaccharide deacetylase family protein [Gammaproteobacteria bacterium]
MLKQIVAATLLLSSAVSYAVEKNDVDAIRNTPLPGTIALTFDDGPNPTFTPQILAILKKNNIKATFFVVGANAKAYPELIKQIHDEGHVVASHSQTHPMLTKLSDKQLKVEISEPSEIVNNIIGIKPRCLRYPFGASNAHVRAEIRAYGMKPTPMGFNSFDYERPGTQKIVSQVLNNIYSKQVILMHDGFAKREQTVAALQTIIDGVRNKKLGFSTIC